MIIEESISINASPEAIFAIYKDVEGWSKWDPDTKEASLDGQFAIGTTGKLVPTKGRGVTMRVTELTPDRSFTVEACIPLFNMKFDHELAPDGMATRAIHRVTFSGPLTFLLGRIVGKQVREGLPKTMLSLKSFAESSRP